MKRLLVFFILPFVLIAGYAQQERSLPMTAEEIEAYVQETKRHVLNTVIELASIPEEQKTFENTIRPLNQLTSDIVESFSVLMYFKEIHLSSEEEVERTTKDMLGFVHHSLMQNRDLIGAVLGYAKQVLEQDKDPYEHYHIQCLLDSCAQSEYLTIEERDYIAQLQTGNAQRAKMPFLCLKGDAVGKSSDENNVSIFSLNTNFIPHRFPILFGGVSLPWQKRVDGIVAEILKIDADVVCLQEVHAEAASYALYEGLKDKYGYFYGAIGPRAFGLTIEALGLPSGLFIASKYPMENPRFTLFPFSGFAMNYGFFDCVIKNGDKPLAHLYTTHMQSLDYEQFAHIRRLQLQEILDRMIADKAEIQEQIPYFLCGDLNIPYGASEPSEGLIRTYFSDAYNRDNAEIGAHNSTCTYYFTNHFFSLNKQEIDPQFQILDYALLLRSTSGDEEYALMTKRIAMNDVTQPDSALSDHHGLLTTITSLLPER